MGIPGGGDPWKPFQKLPAPPSSTSSFSSCSCLFTSHYGKTRCNSSVVYEKKIHKDMITLVGLFTLQKSQTSVKEKAVDQGPKWTFGTF